MRACRTGGGRAASRVSEQTTGRGWTAAVNCGVVSGSPDPARSAGPSTPARSASEGTATKSAVVRGSPDPAPRSPAARPPAAKSPAPARTRDLASIAAEALEEEEEASVVGADGYARDEFIRVRYAEELKRFQGTANDTRRADEMAFQFIMREFLLKRKDLEAILAEK